MNKLLRYTFAFLLLFCSTTNYAQDSCNIRISLLTCTPGAELYSTFGHSALRVTNPVSGQDIVYNYGTFDFAEPGFYMKFIRGKLLYYLSVEDFQSFSEAYRLDNRGITEQVFDLSCTEKETFLAALQTNLLPDNRAYKYDFLFDNCTTRLRDMVEKLSKQKVTYPTIIEEGTRFRQLIHRYLDQNNQQWSKLGIDLLLGSKTDAVMNNREAMFLPDYLLKGFDSTSAGNKRLIGSKHVLFLPSASVASSGVFDHPVFYTSLFLLVIMIFSFSKKPGVISAMQNFDSMFFFLTGILGIIIFLMWFATDHVMCRNNYNIIWALPTHAIAAFLLRKNGKVVRKYLIATIVINLLLLACWFILPQQLNVAIIPLILIIIFRSLIHIRTFRPLITN